MGQLAEAKHKLQRELKIEKTDTKPCHNLSLCLRSNFLVIIPPLSDFGASINGLVGVSKLEYSGENVTIAEFDSISTAEYFYSNGIQGHDIREAFYTFNETEFTIESRFWFKTYLTFILLRLSSLKSIFK